jgi:Tol biopolymer transport system component/DNA-binding winged helix-turn-helix (wHTH) protein
LRTDRQVLLRNGSAVNIAPKVLATLTALVTRPGIVLTRDQLITEVWADSFVEEGNLTQNIFVLRKLLAQDYPHRNPIETLPRVGYRFCEPVQALTDELPIEVDPATEPTRVPAAAAHRVIWGWVALAGVLLAIAGAVGALHRHTTVAVEAAPPRFSLERLTDWESENRVTAAAISPDGRRIAYADADGVVLQTIGETSTRPVRAQTMREIDRLAWFADGLHLLLSGISPDSNQAQVWILSTNGDAPRLLREDAREAVPSPDGSKVAFTAAQSSEVWLVDFSGYGATRLLPGKAGTNYPALLWSLDGRKLLMERRSVSSAGVSGPDPREAGLGFRGDYLSVDATNGRILATMEGIWFNVACMESSGKLLFSRTDSDEDNGSSVLWEAGLDPATGGFRSSPKPVQKFNDYRLLALDVARQTGAIAAVLRTGKAAIYYGELPKSPAKLIGVQRLTTARNTSVAHSWSVDSRSIYFESDPGGSYQIFRQRLDRHDSEPLASSSASDALPRRTPDGRWVLFARQVAKDGPRSLFRVPSDGGVAEQVEIAGPADDFRCPPSGRFCALRWMEDDHTIVYSVLDPISGKGAELYRMNRLSDDKGDWDISPDGSELTITVPSLPTPMIRIVTVRAGSSKGTFRDIPLKLSSAVKGVNCTADGKGWFVSTNTAVGSDLFLVDRTGHATLVWQTTVPTWGVPSPDGKKLAFGNESVDSNVWLLQPEEKK